MPELSGYKCVRGIVVGADADRLIIEATEKEVQQFALQTPAVAVAARPPRDRSEVWNRLMADPHLYDRHGNAVAIVTDFHMTTERIDVTSFGSNSPVYMPGATTLDISAKGLI